MIENIRKYNILIIIGLVVVAAGLIITMQTGGGRGMSGNPYIKIGNRTYTDKEYTHLGYYGRDIVDALARSGDSDIMYRFMVSLSPEYSQLGEEQRQSIADMSRMGGSQFIYNMLFSDNPNSVYSADPEANTQQFFVNRMLVHQAKNEFGIHPSDEQIETFTQQLISFQDVNGEFNHEAYKNFIKKNLGRMGMGERDFRELISDIIATGRIRMLVGEGLTALPAITETSSSLNEQRISGSVGRLELKTFKEQINPTDEELKEYWELIKDSFKTDEQRRFSYVLVNPRKVEGDTPEEDKAEDPNAKKKEDMTVEELAAAKEKEEEEAAKAAEIADKKREAMNEISQSFNDFIIELEDAEGRNFVKLVEEYGAKSNEDLGWVIQSTELFTASNPPEALDIPVRSGGRRGGNVASHLFSMTVSSDPLSKISEPIAAGENQWLVARLEETVEARVKTFEEAREDVRKQYIDEKAVEEIEKAMEEASAKITQSLKDGKKVEEAMKEAGIETVTAFLNTTAMQRQTDPLLPGNLFRAARTIKPGELAEPVIASEFSYLIHVSAREIVEGTITPDVLEGQLRLQSAENNYMAFTDWLKFRAETLTVSRK